MFSEKQQEFYENCNHRWNFKTGATRSGKTYGDYYWIPKRIRTRVGRDGIALILGVSKGTIERNILEPMRTIWGDALVSRISSDNTCRMFGETVYCLGAEKISQVAKIRGSSVKYCYGDEVAEWNKEVFELLKSRLDKEYSVFDGTLNPASPNHWLKKFLDSDADIYKQHYTIFDNPFLPKTVVDELCKEYQGTVYYKRYILGEWAFAEGLILPMFEEAIADLPEGTPREYCLSIDYGTLNAFAAILWGRYGNTWYGMREYYYSGRDTGRQKTDEDYANDLDEFVGEITNLETIIDPSAASMITLLRRRNGKYIVKKANNDVATGIRETASAIRQGKIKIAPTMKNWKNEAGGYVWDDKGDEKEQPLKINDHLMDATRYFVKTKRIAVADNTYISIFNRR